MMEKRRQRLPLWNLLSQVEGQTAEQPRIFNLQQNNTRGLNPSSVQLVWKNPNVCFLCLWDSKMRTDFIYAADK